MKWLKLFFKPPFKDIIELVRENEQLKLESLNLMFLAVYEIQYRGTKYGKVWNYGTTPCYRKHGFNYVTEQIRELIKENEKLKEELISKANQEQKQEIHIEDKNPFFAPDQPGRGKGV